MSEKRRGPRTLAPDEAQRVKEAIERLLAKATSQRELARQLGCSPQAISRVTLGQDPGQTIARQVADALGIPLERLLRGDAADLSDTSLEPRFGALAGWTAAEAEARRRYRHIPEAAWQAVANLRGAAVPTRVTADWIAQLASVYAMALRGEGEDVDPD